jgi:DNA repair exonuclease SbcCD ATPase subunit
MTTEAPARTESPELRLKFLRERLEEIKTERSVVSRINTMIDHARAPLLRELAGLADPDTFVPDWLRDIAGEHSRQVEKLRAFQSRVTEVEEKIESKVAEFGGSVDAIDDLIGRLLKNFAERQIDAGLAPGGGTRGMDMSDPATRESYLGHSAALELQKLRQEQQRLLAIQESKRRCVAHAADALGAFDEYIEAERAKMRSNRAEIEDRLSVLEWHELALPGLDEDEIHAEIRELGAALSGARVGAWPGSVRN